MTCYYCDSQAELFYLNQGVLVTEDIVIASCSNHRNLAEYWVRRGMVVPLDRDQAMMALIHNQ
jgi:hypothetical protein